MLNPSGEQVCSRSQANNRSKPKRHQIVTSRCWSENQQVCRKWSKTEKTRFRSKTLAKNGSSKKFSWALFSEAELWAWQLTLFGIVRDIFGFQQKNLNLFFSAVIYYSMVVFWFNCFYSLFLQSSCVPAAGSEVRDQSNMIIALETNLILTPYVPHYGTDQQSGQTPSGKFLKKSISLPTGFYGIYGWNWMQWSVVFLSRLEDFFRIHSRWILETLVCSKFQWV